MTIATLIKSIFQQGIKVKIEDENYDSDSDSSSTSVMNNIEDDYGMEEQTDTVKNCTFRQPQLSASHKVRQGKFFCRKLLAAEI